MARPKKIVDPDLVEKLASIHCTTPEIAAMCNCSEDTIERRFAGLLKKGRAKGRVSLRRLQWESAQKGNIGMQVWLGKQLLDQRDQPEPPPEVVVNSEGKTIVKIRRTSWGSNAEQGSSDRD